VEVLTVNVITLALHLAALFTILSVVLVVVILALHFIKRRRAGRREAFAAEATPIVKGYFAGKVSLEEAVDFLKRDRSDSLGLLIRISEGATPEESPRLKALLAAFPFEQKEIAALKSKRVPIRLKNAQILGYLRDPAAIPHLLTALDDEVLSVRLAAAQSLALLGDPDTVLPVLLALDTHGEVPQRRVAEVLLAFGQPAVEPMLKVLNAPDTPYSQLIIAVRVCGMLQVGQATPRLIDLLQHDVMPVRLNCVRALGSIGDRSALSAISQLAEDPDWEVRNVVMQAIGAVRASEYSSLLLTGLADAAWWVRYSAAQALYQLGAPGIQALKDASSQSLDRYARDISTQILQEHALHDNPSPTHP
jgi:HEAT repeat protein